MPECFRNGCSERNKTIIIFIGEHLSSSEILIHNLPSFFDALHLSRNLTYHRYQYLSLQPNFPVKFNYYDRSELKSGTIVLDDWNLHITMEQPTLSVKPYFLIKRGNLFSFLYYRPNIKIKLNHRDISMVFEHQKRY